MKRTVMDELMPKLARPQIRPFFHFKSVFVSLVVENKSENYRVPRSDFQFGFGFGIMDPARNYENHCIVC